MSAFVVSRQTMLSAVAAVCALDCHGSPVVYGECCGVRTEAEGAPTEIGRRLFTMNICAVEERYPDTQDDGVLPGEDGCSMEARRFRAPPGRRLSQAELVRGLKALHCLRYQCSEGDVPKSMHYGSLNDAIREVACAIVKQMPEYARAPWD